MPVLIRFNAIVGTVTEDYKAQDGERLLPLPEGFDLNNWSFVGDALVRVQNPSIPPALTRAQFKLALLQLGLLDDIEAAIAASPERALQINYLERSEFERQHPLVVAMGQALGKSEAEIDAVFVLGKTL